MKDLNHAALFLLIPQIECIFKKVTEEQARIPIKKVVLNRDQEKSLGEFFLDKKINPILDPDLSTYCFWFLADKIGLNLRNTVANGLIKFKEVQNHLLIGLIEIILLLIEFMKYINEES